MTVPPTLPEWCDVAFKEWAGVCEALAQGRQSLILRKGGIAEGPGGFTPEHPVFWLYPTHVHEPQQGLRTTTEPAPSVAPDRVPLRVLTVVESVTLVDRPDALPALEPFHVWTEETVLKRFHYRRPGLWVLGVRAYVRAEPAVIPLTPEHAGCKTWVPLEQSVGTGGLSPALDDGEAARRRELLGNALHATR